MAEQRPLFEPHELESGPFDLNIEPRTVMLDPRQERMRRRGHNRNGRAGDSFLALPPDDLVASTPAEFRLVLQRCVDRSGRTGGQIAARAGIHRSQLHYLTKKDSLPRKPDQIKALLRACNVHSKQAQIVMEQWRLLDRSRGENRSEPVPEAPSDDGTLRLSNAVVAELRNMVAAQEATLSMRYMIDFTLKVFCVLAFVVTLAVGLAVSGPSPIYGVVLVGLLAATRWAGLWGHRRPFFSRGVNPIPLPRLRRQTAPNYMRDL